MTYNVFGGTINLAQSIQTCIYYQGMKHHCTHLPSGQGRMLSCLGWLLICTDVVCTPSHLYQY